MITLKVKFDAEGRLRTLTGGVGVGTGLVVMGLIKDAIVVGAQATIKKLAASDTRNRLIIRND